MALALVIAFVVLPLVELYVLIQVGHVIGVLPTIGLLLAVSFLGAWLVKREGAKTWRAFRQALAEGRVPARETFDGALVIVGGALLVAPGFVTDVLGAFCVLPVTRGLVRRLLLALGMGRFASLGLAGRPRVRRVRSERGPAAGRRPANEPRPPALPPE